MRSPSIPQRLAAAVAAFVAVVSIAIVIAAGISLALGLTYDGSLLIAIICGTGSGPAAILATGVAYSRGAVWPWGRAEACHVCNHRLGDRDEDGRYRARCPSLSSQWCPHWTEAREARAAFGGDR